MHRPLRTVAAVISIALTTSGCFTARVSARGVPGIQQRETGVSLLWGLTGTHTRAMECEYGLNSVETFFPWYWWLLSGLTVGIVTPIVKEYTCNASPVHAAQPPPPPPGY
ncbi:MAG: hypothetical protein JNG84_02205 [Archangium sp.]|nr:hypothetical protein [Archangium sp.]